MATVILSGFAWFLYIVPLKQGLKQKLDKVIRENVPVFIHSSIKTRIETPIQNNYKDKNDMFLYIVPLKQGLKHAFLDSGSNPDTVFIHSSIKTRIETSYLSPLGRFNPTFLYIVPLKQGLKLERYALDHLSIYCFYT